LKLCDGRTDGASFPDRSHTDITEEGKMGNSEYRDALNFIVGMTLGALVGTTAALLLAPQSGKRTRRQLARKAEELGDTATEAFDEAREETRRLADRTARETKRLADRARTRADRTSDRLSEAVDRGRERLSR
jgi:gas vesicle protein